MSGEARGSRASTQRKVSATPPIPQSGSFFADPPVPLPSLDDLRATDVLVRAYYNTYAKVMVPPNSSLISVAVSPRTAPMNLDVAENVSHTRRPSSVSPVAAAAEAKTVGEVVGAALAREVVEAAANLYTSRRLDDLVETYTACATWDDARDVVASAFLPQDLRGNGLQNESKMVSNARSLNDTPQHQHEANSSAQSLPTPVFMRSALSLAGVATRTPLCTLTPQSSLYPPPFGTTLPVRRATHSPTGPTPPANVPMDAFSRYVTAVEEAPMPEATTERQSSQLRAPQPRPRATKSKAKSTETATPAAAASMLAPSPPVNANASAKRSTRAPQGRSPKPPQTSSQPEPVMSRGKNTPSTTVQPPPEDPLTRALRHGVLPAWGEGAPGTARTDRLTARPAGAGVALSSSSFPSVVGGNDGVKKAPGKQSPRGPGVIVVEQDRLWSTDRTGKSMARGGQRREEVRCRVVPGEETDDSKPSPEEEEAVVANEDNANGAEAEQERPNKRGNRRAPYNSARAKNAAEVKKKAALAAEQEAKTMTFFSATDAAGETSLQDQVQVIPSPGVTVVGLGSPHAAAQTARRGHKSAITGTNSVLYGGDFTVPADRLALSDFDEKCAVVRKPNAAGRGMGLGKTRSAQLFRSA